MVAEKTNYILYKWRPFLSFMVMRSVDNPAGSHPVRIAQHLETSVVERACQFILLQNEDNNNDVIVQCVSSVKTGHTLQVCFVGTKSPIVPLAITFPLLQSVEQNCDDPLNIASGVSYFRE